MPSLLSIVVFVGEVMTSGQCTVEAPTLQQAEEQFAVECAADATPECHAENSIWFCTAPVEPETGAASGEQSTPTDETPTEETSESSNSGNSSDGGSDNGQCAAGGETIQEARENFANQCPGKVERDCDATDGYWVCGNFNNPTPADLSGETTATSPDVQASEETTTELQEPAEPETGAATPGPDTGHSLPSDSRFRAGDLIAIHFDHAPDYDDGHATVAGRMVVDHYGLNDSVVVVAGTYNQARKNVYRAGSEAVSAVTWGEEGRQSTWYNADARYRFSIQESARIWRKTLEAGGRVWVAEGGPSEFTARVLEELDGIDKSRITVVQHSHCGGQSCSNVVGGQNERYTPVNDIRMIEEQANMVRIGNGNTGNNDTPDLNQRSAAVVRDLEASNQYGHMWRAAFDYFDPTDKIDASDTVELLWILGIDSKDIAGWNQFRDLYLP